MITKSITDRYRKDENIMKQTAACLAFLLIFALLLSACGKQPPVAADPTAPSQQQNTPNTTPTTQPTTPLALTLEEEYEKLLQGNDWYMRALGCIFEKPEELPAYLLFLHSSRRRHPGNRRRVRFYYGCFCAEKS